MSINLILRRRQPCLVIYTALLLAIPILTSSLPETSEHVMIAENNFDDDSNNDVFFDDNHDRMNADEIFSDQRIYNDDDINFKDDYINLDDENRIVGTASEHVMIAENDFDDDSNNDVFFDNDDDQANDDRMNANAIYDDDITFKGDYINLDYENRIVGGIEVDEGEFDFMVSWGGLCGASLIHDQLVLSAAHCQFIRRGVRIRSIYEDRGGITRSIVSRHIHPQYNNTRYENNDFIILELDQPVPNARSSIIELNDDRLEPTRDEILTVIGWGLTSEGGTASEKLLKVGLPAKSHRDCRRVYGPLLNEDIHLCAGFDDGGRDSCQGDSGGPIFSQREDGSNVQVGLVSFGAGCARPRVPGVYSRVSGAYDWIQDKICELATVNRPALCNNRTPQPTPLPTQRPTRPPTRFPTRPPTPFPTQRPTRPPTRFPTRLPTQFPTRPPSRSPTRGPIETPTTQQQSSTDSRMPTRQLPQDFNFNFSFLSSLISKNMNKMKNKNPTTTPTGTPTLTPTTTTQLVSSSFCNREGWNCTEGAICVDDLVCRCDDGYMPNPNLPNSVIVWAGFISCVVDDADALP